MAGPVTNLRVAPFAFSLAPRENANDVKTTDVGAVMDASGARSTCYLCGHASPPLILDGLQVTTFRGVAHENAEAYFLVCRDTTDSTLPDHVCSDRPVPLRRTGLSGRVADESTARRKVSRGRKVLHRAVLLGRGIKQTFLISVRARYRKYPASDRLRSIDEKVIGAAIGRTRVNPSG